MKKFALLALSFLVFNSSLAVFSDDGSIPEYADFSIKILNHKKIFTGNSDGSFRPEAQINRAEFSKILVGATGIQKFIPLQSSFSDVDPDDWFFPYVETAKKNGWLSGYPDGSFRPGAKINRAEIAKILSLAFKFEVDEKASDKNWYDKYVRVLQKQKLFPHAANNETFDPAKNPTRAEIAEHLFRFMKKRGKISSFEMAQFSEETPNNTPAEISTDPTISSKAPASFAAPATTMTASSSAGKLYLNKINSLKKITVSKGQTNITAHELSLYSSGGNSNVAALTFRRIGNGKISNFKSIWLEKNGTRMSSKITPNDDLVKIPLLQTTSIGSGKQTWTLKVDMASNAAASSSRFTLFLPEWIDSNAQSKIGFFPFGGRDIEVK